MVQRMRWALATAIVLVAAGAALAGETALNRQDVTVIKKKLVEVQAALGALPEGYVVNREDFNLPTDASETDGGYEPAYASASFRYDGGSEQMARKSSEELEAEYRKKMMEMQAAGDYEGLARLSQEMVKKATEAQMAADGARREPVDVEVRANGGPVATIDPDAVVCEGPGYIALRQDNYDGNATVVLYCDPVGLKDTQTLARIDLSEGRTPSKAKTTWRHVAVELTGPRDVVEAWAKSIDKAKVLAQVDR
ncbi:MAG TPA: hypothetical protein PLQ13_01000 [Candidatus Krumholzibacteria bacterium]|nr:hypothetical protein [Candidatus Krumholzibacteria bacterium]